VVDLVEARLDIALKHPLVVPSAGGHVDDLGDGVVSPALRAEAVGTRLEVRLEDRLEHQLQGRLDGAVPGGRYAQPPELAAPLGDEPLPHGQRDEPSGLEIISQPDEVPPAEDDGARCHSVDPRCPCPSIAPDPVPGHNQEGRIAHEVVEVIEATVGVVDGPLMQLRLNVQYPLLRLVEARPRRIGVHRCPPGIPARGLRTRCPPSPCGRFSRPRTTTGAPSPRRAVG